MKATSYHSEPGRRFLRPILVGIILVILNVFWVVNVDAIWRGRSGMHLTAMSIFFNAFFCLFFIILANLLLQRYLPRYAFDKDEILIIYVMMNMASGISGIGLMRIMTQSLTFPFWYATPENEWANLIQPYVPEWFCPQDMSVLRGYYRGESSLYIAQNLRVWFVPMASWTCFIFAFVCVMIFTNVLLRKRWVEQEKLTYPITQLPMEIMDNSKGFFRNRLMWCGFAIAAGIDLINGFSFFFPAIPNIYVKMTDMGRYFPSRPLNALGWFPISFYPFIIGLGFLIPVDLSFSFWFFYLVWKLQSVLLAILGKSGGQVYGFQENSIHYATGALLALCGIALWQARKHLAEAFKFALGRKARSNDSSEPASYRTALVGLLLSGLFLVFFCYQAGMSLWVIMLFFPIYYGLCIAITRMRAEMGVPVHDHHNGGPDIILSGLFGSRALGATNLTIMSYTWFFNRTHYSDVMPHQLEGFKMADKMRLSNKRLMVPIIISMFVAIVATFWAILHYSYQVGMEGRLEWLGYEPFNRLQSWLSDPREPDYSILGSLGIGAIIYVFLMVMRNRFFWWPLHPAGFAVSNSWGANVAWFPVFIGWLIKSIILKSGGLKAHSKAVPFFFGLMSGEFVVGTFWCLWGAITNDSHYSFFPYGI